MTSGSPLAISPPTRSTGGSGLPFSIRLRSASTCRSSGGRSGNWAARSRSLRRARRAHVAKAPDESLRNWCLTPPATDLQRGVEVWIIVLVRPLEFRLARPTRFIQPSCRAERHVGRTVKVSRAVGVVRGLPREQRIRHLAGALINRIVRRHRVGVSAGGGAGVPG
jgi:hypothetical protein